MDKSKALLVIEPNDKEDIFFSDWKKQGYNAEILFKHVNKSLRLIRRWFMRNGILMSIWLNDWSKELDKYDVLILHMSRLTRYLPQYIISKYPNLKVICWYRNTITKDNEPIMTSDENIEYWSFDENDCLKYNIKHNIQYYCNSDIDSNIEKEYDVYFIGYEKGREKEITEFVNVANQNNLVCDIHIVRNNDEGFVPYSVVKKELNKTKAVLEINKANQVGFTLRTMESLFYGIKLITNNSNVKKSPIYNKNNVFLIGEDNYDNLKEFINSPYDHSVDYLKEENNLDAWFKNFFI